MPRISAVTRLLLVSTAVTMFTAVAFATPPDANRAVSGAGIIDRVISAGSEPVFRADGYPFRVVSTTEVHFSGGLQALTEVTTNICLVQRHSRHFGSGRCRKSRIQ